MPKPHGGKLINRSIKKEPSDLSKLPKFEINANLSEDVLNISNGVFSPLKGFLCRNDLENVLNEKRLEDDTPWTIPILLDLNKKDIKDIQEGDRVLLTNKENGVMALLDIDEIYTYNKKTLAQAVYGTQDTIHPGVTNINNMKQILLGGKITILNSKTRNFDEYNLSPKETRILFKEKRWKEIVAFQTRNPPHIGHEYVQKTALTF
ncbi:MAG: sulfate adenylyltransferase, partial [Thermoplasmatales archaeon]